MRRPRQPTALKHFGCVLLVALMWLDSAHAATGALLLDGQWNVSWGQLLSPTDTSLPETPQTLQVPSVWTVPQSHRAGGNATLGCATLWRDIELPAGVASRDLGLYLPELDSASRVYLVAQERAYLLHEVGQVSCDPATEVPLWRTQLERLPEGLSGQVRLVWQLSNHHFVRGGPVNTPELGVYSKLAQRSLLGTLWGAGLVGLLLVLAIYHFSISFERPEELASRYFALLCFILALRQGVVMRLIERIGETATLEGFIWRDRVEYFTMLLAVVVALRFLAECVPSIWIRRSTVFAAVVAIAYGAVILFTEPIVFAGLVGWYQGAMLGVLVVSMVEGLRLALAGNRMAGWAILGWMPLGVAAVLDVLKSQDLIELPYASTYGLIVMAVIQGVVLARRFADASKTAERLTKNLRAEVRRQTQALAERTEEAEALLEELKRTQGHLVESNRLATVGRLASGLAHELRNPLNISNGGTEMLRETLEELQKNPGADSDALDDLDVSIRMVEKGGARINALIEQVHVLAGAKEYLSNESTSVRCALESSLAHLETFLSDQGIELTMQLDAEATDSTWVSSQGIALIVEKLVQNASQALEKQERKTLRVGLVSEPQSEDSVELGVALYLSDNGPGISDAVAETLFEPFVSGYTTLTQSGMGLAIARQIATLADGSLTLEPSAQGACFRLWLPKA